MGSRYSVNKVLPVRESLFSSGLLEASKCIPTAPTFIATGSPADLFLFHIIPDITLASIGVEGDFRSFQHQEQFCFVFVSTLQCLVQSLNGVRSPFAHLLMRTGKTYDFKAGNHTTDNSANLTIRK